MANKTKPKEQSKRYQFGNSQFGISCPCRDCKERHEDCHNDCQAYKQFCKDVEKANRTARKNSLIVKDKLYYTNLMGGGKR